MNQESFCFRDQVWNSAVAYVGTWNSRHITPEGTNTHRMSWDNASYNTIWQQEATNIVEKQFLSPSSSRKGLSPCPYKLGKPYFLDNSEIKENIQEGDVLIVLILTGLVNLVGNINEKN